MTNSSNPAASAVPVRRRGKRILLVLVVIALGLAGGAVWHWSGDGGRAAAIQDCRAGEFARAEPVLKSVLVKHPDDVEVLDCLAHGYLAADRLVDAEPHLSTLIRLRPDNADYLRLRWDLYRQQKLWEQAYADARRLIELEPNDEDLRRKAMGEAFSAGQFAGAEELCRALLTDHPGDRKLQGMLAQIRLGRGDDDGAGRILDELIRTDPKDYGALQARGILYDDTGHPEMAIPLLRQVFAEDPKRGKVAGYPLAVALRKVGQAAEAEKVLAEVRRTQELELADDAIKNQPDNLDLRVRLAKDLIRDGYAADGLRILNEALERAPGFAPAHRALAEYYAKEGKADLADKHRRLAGAANPSDQ
jgi:predicted Zn-dependent protease